MTTTESLWSEHTRNPEQADSWLMPAPSASLPFTTAGRFPKPNPMRIAGGEGVPVMFVSGDDRLRDDLMPLMPWLKYVVTKDALSPATVALRPVDTVHREMREGAAAAVRELPKASRCASANR